MIGIEDLLSVPVRQLNLGQRMRCEIVSALLHTPEILFLDEPTLGLDARSKVSVHKFIKRINKRQGVTVILTTHDMADIEALTERVIVIGNGKKLYDGNFFDIRKEYSSVKKIVIKSSDPRKSKFTAEYSIKPFSLDEIISLFYSGLHI